ncbi:hypothetical protein Vadar_030356 [Vaccinium darrowii]|uniref:Uncharacterized protein n=1 Tax=Vaccinium darrowii TaxID=229202 RepID=A0ACB7XV45_9ERIC|nr:hypothetical protein Vadar_030356 [Vaccinium darrowii]
MYYEDNYEYQSVKWHSKFEGFYRTDDNFSNFQESPIIPSFNAHCNPENFIYWFRKVDKFFAFYTGIPEKKEVKYVAHKLQGHAFTWWEQLQSNRMRQYKQPVRTWRKMRQLMSARFLNPQHSQMLYQDYRRKLKSKRSCKDNLDLPYSFPCNENYVVADIEISKDTSPRQLGLSRSSLECQQINQGLSNSDMSHPTYYDGYEIVEEEGDRVELGDEEEVGADCEGESSSSLMLERQSDLDDGATTEVVEEGEYKNIATIDQIHKLKGEKSLELGPIVCQSDNVTTNVKLCEPSGSITCSSDEVSMNALNVTSFTTNSVMDLSQEHMQFQHKVQSVDFVGIEQFEPMIHSRSINMLNQLKHAIASTIFVI